ncbi:MAG: zinc ribbon domain-containing protein [Promethearchaeia archaeon]
MILKPRISGGVSYKRRWEFFAAIAGIALGYPLYLITLLIPGYSSAIIYEAIPSLFRGLFVSINDTSINNPYFPLAIFFISFIEFPSCLAWTVPGYLIGYYRNKQYHNVEIKNNGWKVFWHGAYFIQAAFIIFSIGLFFVYLFQFLPGFTLDDVQLSFFGSGILYLMLFFISPFFWMGLLSAGLGGFLGSKLGLKEASQTEVVIEEVEAEKIFEEEEAIISEQLEEAEVKETLWPEEAAKQIAAEEEIPIQEVNVAKLKARIKETAPETMSEQEIEKCPGCGKQLPAAAKFCNKCGTKLT